MSCPSRQERRLARIEPAGLLIGLDEERGSSPCGLDVGLVERIDADDRARDRRGDLPAEEFLADRVAAGSVIRTTGLTRSFERREPSSSSASASPASRMDEQPVVAIGRRVAGGLGVDRDQALASLPVDSASNCSSQAPRSAIAARRDDRQLVPPGLGGFADDRRPAARRDWPPAERRRRRNRPSVAWRRERPARRGRSPPRAPCRRATARNSVRRSRVAVEDTAEAVAPRDLLQIRARIGDGDEAAARFALAEGPFDQIEEIGSQQVRLHRRAGFAGDDEQGARRVDRGGDAADLAGVGESSTCSVGMTGGAAERRGRAPRGRGSIRPCRAARCPDIRRASAAKAFSASRSTDAPRPAASQPSH